MVRRTNGLQRPWNGHQIAIYVLLTYLTASFLLLAVPVLPTLAFQIFSSLLLLSLVATTGILGYCTIATDPIDAKLSAYLAVSTGDPANVGVVTPPLLSRSFPRVDAFLAVLWGTLCRVAHALNYSLSSSGSADVDEGGTQRRPLTKYCWLCETTVHSGSMHCKYCEKCVGGFDHHCQWLNTCIGSSNYRYFGGAVASVAFFLTWFTACECVAVVYAESDRRGGGGEGSMYGSSESVRTFLVVANAVNLGFGLLLLGTIGQLLWFHIKLRRMGLTTYEFILVDGRRRREREEEMLRNRGSERWKDRSMRRCGWSKEEGWVGCKPCRKEAEGAPSGLGDLESADTARVVRVRMTGSEDGDYAEAMSVEHPYNSFYETSCGAKKFPGEDSTDDGTEETGRRGEDAAPLSSTATSLASTTAGVKFLGGAGATTGGGEAPLSPRSSLRTLSEISQRALHQGRAGGGRRGAANGAEDFWMVTSASTSTSDEEEYVPPPALRVATPTPGDAALLSVSSSCSSVPTLGVPREDVLHQENLQRVSAGVTGYFRYAEEYRMEITMIDGTGGVVVAAGTGAGGAVTGAPEDATTGTVKDSSSSPLPSSSPSSSPSPSPCVIAPGNEENPSSSAGAADDAECGRSTPPAPAEGSAVLPIAVLDVDESSGSGQSPPDPLGLKQSVEPSGDQVPMSASAGAEWGVSAPIPPMTPADVSHEGPRERETATDAGDTTSATSIRPNSPLHGMLEKTPAVPADTAALTSCASPIAGTERQPSVVESSAAGDAPATAQMINTHETIVGSMTDAGSSEDGGSRDASGPLNVDDAILSPVTHPDVSALVDMNSMQSKSSLPSDGSFEKAPVPANVNVSTCGSDNILKPFVPSAQELLPVALIDSGTGGTTIEDPGLSEHIGDANSVGGNDDPKFAVESVGSTGPMSIQTEHSTDPIDTGGSAEDLVQTAAVPPFKTPMDAVDHSPSPWKNLQEGSDVTSPVSCSTTEGLVGVGDQTDTLQNSFVGEDMFLL
mmetsp:Transcript_39547/g.77272  ORF Transcript_39547/g.77272 Transcript_39547/m.77272 type:complete len:1011 (+) Transcript_39547:170-3202(+)